MRRIGEKVRQGKAADPNSRAGRPVSIKIRRAKPGDLSAVVGMSAGVNEIENYPGQVMKAGDFRHFLGGRDAFMLVAVAPGKTGRREEVLGYVTVYRSENYYYLPYAVTKKARRRHGIGGALLDEVERLAKEEKVEYILMSVYAYNAVVGTFLKVRGYVPSKKLIQYSKMITTKGRK